MKKRRPTAAWLPNLEGGVISFLLEALAVLMFAVIGFAMAAVALWIF